LSELKIALISEEYPPFSFGGVGSFCYDLAHALSRKKINVTVFCGRATKISVEKVNENFSVVRLPCFDFPPRFFWFQLQNFSTFLKLLKGFSVIHIANPEIGPAVLLASRLLNKPTISTIHGTYTRPLRLTLMSPTRSWIPQDIGYQLLGYPLHQLSNGLCIKNSNHVTVVSSNTLSEMEISNSASLSNRFSVIHNGIHLEEFVGEFEGPKSENPSIISFGRLYWNKGFKYLIEAIANIKDDFPNLKVTIYGDGPMKEDLKSLVAKYNLQQMLQINDFIPRRQLIKEIKRADIAVFPSIHEAQPIAVLESMACGKPVIAFDLPFSREVITDKQNGLLAKPANVKDLSAKIRSLLLDENLRLRVGQAGRKYVSAEHDWNILADKFISLYEKVARA
jgi:glycosyltransferase involved in cell wall biosynthesis